MEFFCPRRSLRHSLPSSPFLHRFDWCSSNASTSRFSSVPGITRSDLLCAPFACSITSMTSPLSSLNRFVLCPQHIPHLLMYTIDPHHPAVLQDNITKINTISPVTARMPAAHLQSELAAFFVSPKDKDNSRINKHICV